MYKSYIVKIHCFDFFSFIVYTQTISQTKHNLPSVTWKATIHNDDKISILHDIEAVDIFIATICQ